MGTTVNERLMSVMSEYGLTEYAFSKRINVAKSTINEYFKEGSTREPSLSVIRKVLSVFTEISPIWLYEGKGEMMISGNLPPMTGNETETQLLEAANETLKEKVKGLEKTIALQEALIKEKDKRLAMFEELLHGSHEDYIEEKRKSV